MTRVVCHPNPGRLPRATGHTIPVQLYDDSEPGDGVAMIGRPILREIRRLGIEVPQTAFDFMTVALAVTAADTFVLRDNADDAWTREIELVVPVARPAAWTGVVDELAVALNFLSGDRWTIEVTGGGQRAPAPQDRGSIIQVPGHDSVCLFSGGLDSTIGVIDLIAEGKRPLLVSHAYRGDAEHQLVVHSKLPVQLSRFAPHAYPTGIEPMDVSMRTRSLNFIAFGAVTSSVLARWNGEATTSLSMPENGLIALNPPLTRRRIGSLSTRTTHPHFLELVRKILLRLNLPVRLNNPCALKTKGEMMRSCLDQATLAIVASRTVSCGKWKRKNMQCGRCVPCLIRRAAFHAAGIDDRTSYRFGSLSTVLANEDERNDLLSMMLAVKRANEEPLEPWVSLSGPLPSSPVEREEHVDVFRRGMAEMGAYLRSNDLIG